MFSHTLACFSQLQVAICNLGHVCSMEIFSLSFCDKKNLIWLNNWCDHELNSYIWNSSLVSTSENLYIYVHAQVHELTLLYSVYGTHISSACILYLIWFCVLTSRFFLERGCSKLLSLMNLEKYMVGNCLFSLVAYFIVFGFIKFWFCLISSLCMFHYVILFFWYYDVR